MDATTGQRLTKARLAKGLSVDEVAHATKLRPDKVLALEHDDYSRFPNNAYVKGFLQLYARFLGVDVRAALSELENPSPVSISDYQYLNAVPEKEPERIAMRRKSSKPSVVPLVVFVILCAIAAGGGYLYKNMERLGNLDQLASADGGNDDATAKALPATPASKPSSAPAPVEPQAQPVDASPPGVAPDPTASSDAVASDREFVAQAAPPDVEETTSVLNEVVIEPVRKTWVTVRKGDARSTPIFEDFLYTNAPPLKLHGARFFIEVRDEGAVVIRKNGAPIAYQASGVTVQ